MNGEILYKKIYDGIIKKIKSGEYQPGDLLPPQNLLSEEYNVSLITVKKALQYAEEKGIVVRQRGRRAEIANVDLGTSDNKILLLIVIEDKKDNDFPVFEKPEILLTLKNNWITTITDSLISNLPEDYEFLSATYSYEKIFKEYEQTVIPCMDRIVLFGNKNQSLIDFLNNQGKKVAVFGTTNAKNCAIVSNNDREISRKAVNYLISSGHKKIAFIGTNSKEGDFAERYNGYLEALASNGLSTNGFLLRWCPSATSNEGYKSMYEILLSAYRDEYLPTAVFCGNDNLAYGALQAISKFGMSCPKDISIIGVDNCLEICEKSSPQLSSVDKNFANSGKQLAKILSRSKWENDVSLIKCSLVIRDSIQEINKKN